ncbi:sperm-associated microtubule inner protein 4 [Dromaius novaehollandiae]|uniref:sperm-associated microtubule inner protein 4 n=1 Tax=Dromaius novaehollandiae TaxID=8790 RepID=UPI003120557D
MLPDLAHYYREMEGTDILSRTFESNEILTPLQIPSRPTVSQDRYNKFRESLHWCRLPWGTEREHGGTALLVLPEEHRAKDQPACALVKGHQHYGSAVDPWPRGLPIEQYYYVAQLKKSDVRMNDELLHKPPDSLAKPLCLPFPTSHPYQTHISRYTMFPNFRSTEDRYTGVEASHHQPFHPNTPTKAFDVVVLRKTKGNPYRHEVVSIPSDFRKEAVHWLGQHTYFHLPKLAEQKDQIYCPNPPKTVAPNSTLKDLEHKLSPRTTNMLRNSERAQWITTYSRDFTGRGPMNPLNLDDYDMKVLDKLTQELGEDMELKETFLPSLSQVRPLEGRTARLLQGRHPHESILQEQHSSNVQMPPPLYSVHTTAPSYSDTMLSKIKATANEQCKVTENTDQKWDVSQKQAHLSQISYQKDDYLDTRPPANKFQKITDAWQTEALYWRQLAGRPKIESLPKSVCSPSYKDLKPSHLDQYRIRNNRGSLHMPSLPQDVKSEESGTIMHKLWHQEASQPLWRSEDRPRKTALPECIPSYKIPQHRTTLLELHDSFSKTAAHKHFHDSIKGETKDLRDNITERRRHKFCGFNSFYFYN